ncbi:MAG: hypothetical protein U5K70_06900 [Halodesulfurarchaeum sp.]|nr:hypothetical protein [Halodesulfurarchaeum sp.]
MQPPTSDLDVDHQPPLSLPFAHFLVSAFLLLLGGGVASLGPLVLPIRASSVGTLHLLLAGWLGLTIMGAMIQFVPVWSGTKLHSERLSLVSLWFVVVGVSGVVGVFFSSAYAWFPLLAGILLVGFWVFGYTIIRSLPPVSEMDITEAHFLLAVGSLLLATVFGWLLATSFAFRVLDSLPVSATGLLMAHLTLTVFGFVSLTIVGALYQLAPMFTQAPASSLDTHLAHVEMVALPVGVFGLSFGRLFQLENLARASGILLSTGLLAFALILLRRLWRAQVEPGPMLRRYWLVGLSVLGWVAVTVPRWLGDPLSYFLRFGSPQGTHLLFVGFFTLTVVGTFYHVVPFIVWFHEYSDRLGYEPVPMIDDLYHAGIARVEFWLLAIGLGTLWAGELLGAPTWVIMVGGNVLGGGVILFAFNMGLVVRNHRPETIREIFELVTFRRGEQGK